jgi:class 3 adenylate cyclase
MNETENPTIQLSSDVTEFFAPVVEKAIQDKGYEATDAAQTYLVALLADYTRPGQLNAETLSRPLTLLLDEALHAAGHERFERLRTLGDGVLYVSGFFAEHLENRGVERGYVSALGARAYETASSMLRHGPSEGAAPDLFSELSEKFRMFVALFADVADAIRARSAHSNRAVLDLYERWLRTGSTSLAAALTSRGMVPVRGSGMVH